jgi:hypothetical protein
MEFTLTFTDRSRYCKAIAAIDRNPRYTLIVRGRDYSYNTVRPWETCFYVTFKREV